MEVAMASSSRVLPSQTSGAVVADTGTDGDDVVHISDGEEEARTGTGSKRKLTSKVWNDFEKECVDGVWKARCNHCGKKLSAVSRNADNQKRGYMAVTGHFIDDTWTLKSCILRFMYVPCPHTTEAICDSLHKCLQSWDIDRRVSTITLDNCSTNDCMIGLMETRLGASNMLLKGKWLHMRCCTHILNPIVKDGMEVIATAVSNIRESIAYWVATPKRYGMFEKTALDENVELDKKLQLDCKTRWNSTYIMLNIAIPCRKVFERLDELDRNYTCPPPDDWIFASIVCEKLELFYDLTELFSGTKYVTANLFFPKVCEVKLKLKSWEHDEHDTVRDMSAAMIAKYDKYWTDIHGLMVVAIILDPRLKMTMLHACYVALFGEEHAESYVTEAHQLLTDLMKHYHVKEQDFVGTSSSGASSSVGAAAVLSIFKTLSANKKTTSFVRSKNELNRYLDEETLPYDENDYFDVLGWWKLEGTCYPTLRQIARDILAIPITTVASESAFSTSGRVLSEHRSRLTPKMLEALMCSQSWLRHTLKDDADGRMYSFWSCLQDIQEEMSLESCITADDSD